MAELYEGDGWFAFDESVAFHLTGLDKGLRWAVAGIEADSDAEMAGALDAVSHFAPARGEIEELLERMGFSWSSLPHKRPVFEEQLQAMVDLSDQAYELGRKLGEGDDAVRARRIELLNQARRAFQDFKFTLLTVVAQARADQKAREGGGQTALAR